MGTLTFGHIRILDVYSCNISHNVAGDSGEQLPDTVDDTCNLGKKRLPADEPAANCEKQKIVENGVLANNHIHSVSKQIDIENAPNKTSDIMDKIKYGSHDS